MLTRPSELRVFLDALKALINNGNPNSIGRVEGLIRDLLRREPALRGKVDVLNALKKGIELDANVASDDSVGYAATVLEFIAKMLREFQPDK